MNNGWCLCRANHRLLSTAKTSLAWHKHFVMRRNFQKITMKIRKDILLQTLKGKCNTDNFTSIAWRTNVGFTQKYNGKNYFVSVFDLENGWIKANVHQYGKFAFDYEMEVCINRKRDLWKLQKTLMKAGIFLTHGTIKRFIYAA